MSGNIFLEETSKIRKELNDYLNRSGFNIEFWESDNEEKILKKYEGYQCLISYFINFFLLSVQLSLDRGREFWSEKEAWLTGISTVTFWRFRASYLLFKNGYPVEAICLLRGIFENILTITALLKNIINTEHIFTEIPPGIDMSNEKLARKIVRKGTRKIDNKVKIFIIGKNSGLSPEAQDYFATTLRCMNNATHRSMANILRHVSSWLRGENILYPLPMVDDRFLREYINISSCLAWIIVIILPKIYEKGMSVDNQFIKYYNSINELFSKMMDGDKNKRYIVEFISKIE